MTSTVSKLWHIMHYHFSTTIYLISCWVYVYELWQTLFVCLFYDFMAVVINILFGPQNCDACLLNVHDDDAL